MNRTYRVCTLRGTKGKVEETVRNLTEHGFVDAAWTIRVVEPEETQPYIAVEIEFFYPEAAAPLRELEAEANEARGVRLLASALAAMYGYKSFL